MKRGRDIMIILFLILLIIPLISAGFFSDFWGKLTGQATKGVGVNITVGQPAIVTVYNDTLIPDPSLNFNSGPAMTGIVINFTVYHGAGTQFLNDSTVIVNFSSAVSGEELREANSSNSICTRDAGFSTYYVNFTCNVTMWWWDTNGTWTINAFIKDNNSNAAWNNTQTFQVALITGFDMSPLNLTWPALGAGAINQTSNNDPLTLNNTGNKQIGIHGYNANISVNATHLAGETDESKRIFADNFTVSWDGNTGTCAGPGALCTECDTSTGRASSMAFATFKNITNTNLTKGNYTINNNYTGQEQLYFCLGELDSALTTQSYSTLGNGTWVVQI